MQNQKVKFKAFVGLSCLTVRLGWLFNSGERKMKFVWTYSLSFALGVIIPFEIYDWKFWIAAFVGNALIFLRDYMLMPNIPIKGSAPALPS